MSPHSSELKQQLHQLQLKDAVLRQENYKLQRQIEAAKKQLEAKEKENQKLKKQEILDQQLIEKHEIAILNMKQAIEQKGQEQEIQALEQTKVRLQERLKLIKE